MKAKPELLVLDLQRHNERQQKLADSAPEAAKLATKLAKQGWDVVVRSINNKTLMHCFSVEYLSFVLRKDVKSTTVARCTISPAFKKRIRGSRAPR